MAAAVASSRTAEPPTPQVPPGSAGSVTVGSMEPPRSMLSPGSSSRGSSRVDDPKAERRVVPADGSVVKNSLIRRSPPRGGAPRRAPARRSCRTAMCKALVGSAPSRRDRARLLLSWIIRVVREIMPDSRLRSSTNVFLSVYVKGEGGALSRGRPSCSLSLTLSAYYCLYVHSLSYICDEVLSMLNSATQNTLIAFRRARGAIPRPNRAMAPPRGAPPRTSRLRDSRMTRGYLLL